jgi:antitoxin component HigA of HigAB toxin-antitoxin module
MQVEIIKNKKQYEKALQRFEEIFLAKNNSKEGKQSQILVLAIKDYESKHFKIKT